MLQLLLPTGRRKMPSLTCSSRLSQLCQLTNVMCYVGTSMHVWDKGLVKVMSGGMRGGPYGHEVLIEARRELLSFVSIKEATVWNTWFVKKAIYKQTWQHPKSKQWHCIYYAIMRKAHQRRCLDVMVVRGAQCNTDHMTVKVKVQVGRKPRRSRQERQLVGKFDVSRLQG